jgi:hypothetical protein
MRRGVRLTAEHRAAISAGMRSSTVVADAQRLRRAREALARAARTTEKARS